MDFCKYRKQALVTASALITSLGIGCFSEDRKPQKAEQKAATEVSGELFEIASARGLDPAQVRAAMQTFVPTGARDSYIGLMGTGTSGRLAVFGMPSMRILKYVGVFTPEPWQGFAYDDESRDLLRRSSRDEIEYTFGDSGQPALSEKAGVYDALAAFITDGANARVAVLHLDDYETKQIVTNPVFRSSFGAVIVTPDTEYVVQNTSAPELPAGQWVDVDDPKIGSRLRGGITFWPFERGDHSKNRIAESGAFTVELPPYVQGESDAGKGASAGLVFTLGFCRGSGVVPGVDKSCGKEGTPAVLHVVDIKKAKAAVSGSGHRRASLAAAVKSGALRQVELPAGPTSVAVSPDGKRAIVTHEFGDAISVIDLEKLKSAEWSSAAKDDFGVPTLAGEAAGWSSLKVGGPSADASFAADDLVYVSVIEPGKLLRVSLQGGKVLTEFDLDFPGGKLTIPQGETSKPSGDYAIVMNTDPGERFVSVGPVQAMNPYLVDISGDKMSGLYDMAVPQSTRIEAVALPAKDVDAETVVRYAQGTNPRSGQLSKFRTAAGEERVERKGNRVHVFGTLIRSHITPEIVEVNEGDVVTFHLTNLEQAQDQTHGFTISALNVHSSWEPGKVASVTFTTDVPGVYPYYCTEFCSALHLEMMGYLLVRPKGFKGKTELGGTASPKELAAAEKEYKVKMKAIADTQAVIDSVVTWLNDNNYKKDPRAVSLVNDAVAQLKSAKEIQSRIDAAVKKGDWVQARLWAEQFYQYQVKAADAGVRAKKIIEEGSAK